MKKQLKNGFTLAEILVVVLIFSFLMSGLFAVLLTGQRSWHVSDVSIELQQDLRSSLMRITRELHQSGFKCNDPPACTNTTIQVTIAPNPDVINTDILRFKLPVDYNRDGYIKNNNGIVELWGANLTWGCSDFGCQKPKSPESQNNNYQIEYLLDVNKQLIRRVLNTSSTTIQSDIYATNLIDFQASINGNIVTIQLTAEKKPAVGDNITSNLSVQILLRNRG
ncbi:MAG: prepilin-type N-terminal cleavage/methylation domain-containing protein [Candidatus Omnitrophota bacterium]|nr:prepilin-type N-terminal cleavage/methylation domain-containing protein [Candidatus Omnitrophota bacterium]